MYIVSALFTVFHYVLLMQAKRRTGRIEYPLVVKELSKVLVVNESVFVKSLIQSAKTKKI